MNKKTLPSLPQVVNSEMVYEGYMKIRRDNLQKDNGQRFQYENLLINPVCVIVLAQQENGCFVLNQEYRHPTGEIILGCPGGLVEPGEEPKKAAERELLEETGYAAEDFSIIGRAYPAPGLTGQMAYFVWAKNARFSQQPKLEVGEIVQPIALSLEEIRAWSFKDTLDGLLASALFFFTMRSLAGNSPAG